MRDDYVRHCSARRRRYSRNESHAGLWVFTIFLFIAFTIGLVLLGKYHRHGSGSGYKAKQQIEQVEQKEIAVPKPVEQKHEETQHVHLSSTTHQSAKKVAVQNETATVAPPATHFEFATPQSSSQSQASTLDQDAAQKIATESNDESKKLQKETVAKKTEQVASHKTKDGEYFLDVIKTKNKLAAEKTHARLALMGVESSVIVVKEKKVIYYAITLGPYDKNTAVVRQQLLKDNDIKSVVR